MPTLEWDVNKAISYAEKLWIRLDAKGYGEPKQTGKHEVKNAYSKLTPVMKTAFDLFWLAFDYKEARDEAAGSWLNMAKEDHTKATYDKIIAAAKQTAMDRKNLPEGRAPKMAQGWLSSRRWNDKQATPVDEAEKQRREQQQALQKISQDLAHAKKMAEQTEDPFWYDEATKLTETLRKQRDKYDQQPQA
jgi:hypothetical protein